MKRGDRVRVVDLHEDDAYYHDRAVYIGKEATVEVPTQPDECSADAGNGYFSMTLDFGGGIINVPGFAGERLFHGIKVEPVV